MRHQLRKLSQFVLAIAIAAVPCLASTVQKMELQELGKTSDSIVHGHVESVQARFENKMVYTYTLVAVDDPLKGDRRQTVLLKHPGGTIGAMTMFFAGMPQFKAGDQVIVFLKNRQDGTFDVIGLNQGKYDVVNDVAVSNVSGVSLLDPKTGLMSDAGFVAKAPLEAFKAKIRELAR